MHRVLVVVKEVKDGKDTDRLRWTLRKREMCGKTFSPKVPIHPSYVVVQPPFLTVERWGGESADSPVS